MKSKKKLAIADGCTSLANDWRNLRILLTGKKDGFKWYIGEYDLPFFAAKIVDPSTSKTLMTTIVRLAYVDVTGTKLDGITNTSVIDELGIDLYCGCTFAGAGEMAALLMKDSQLRDHWFVGEDYAHDMFGMQAPVKLEYIAKHLESETIPSIVKALVVLDIKDPNFNGQEVKS